MDPQFIILFQGPLPLIFYETWLRTTELDKPTNVRSSGEVVITACDKKDEQPKSYSTADKLEASRKECAVNNTLNVWLMPGSSIQNGLTMK